MKKLICLFLALLFITPATVSAAEMLIPVGELVGIRLNDGTVTVADAGDTNLAAGDILQKIDKTPITCLKDVENALLNAQASVSVQVRRGNHTKVLSMDVNHSGGPKLGISLKEGIAGVGTITFYDPDSGSYGALGHGVNSREGGLLSLRSGKIYDASVAAVKKGKVGTPGQLMGVLNTDLPLGEISKNTDRGIFGKVEKQWQGQPIPTADPAQVKTGAATIRSTINDGSVQEYSVEILKIYPENKDSDKNLLIHITDQTLLSATGGIVQGMSGSPIIQDGKLIGAVTHVLVNDPTTGYGIFIENMLDAAA